MNRMSIKVFGGMLKLVLVCLLFGLFPPVLLPGSVNYYGQIGVIRGVVEVLPAGSKDWKPAVEAMPVRQGDRIKTGERASCCLELDDGSVISIGAGTETAVDSLEATSEKHDSVISMYLGKIIANIAKTKNTKMQLRTPTAVVAVRGTEFAADAAKDSTEVGVFSGQVDVKNADVAVPGEVTLKPDEETSVPAAAAPERPKYLSDLMKKNKERNSELRNRVKALREKFARTTPGQRAAERELALKRFDAIKAGQAAQKEKLRDERRELRKSREKIRMNKAE